MAKVFVDPPRDPERDSRPMVYITIAPEPKADDDARLSFKEKTGFGFRMRREDAIELAAAILKFTKAT